MSYAKLGYSPFQSPMVFTTTKQVQSWTIKASVGAQYRFNWGDGTETVVTGNGASQTSTHDYGSASTRTIRFLMQDLSKLLQFNCSSNLLQGALPDFSKCVNIDTLYLYTNLFSGTFPSLRTCTKLANCAFHYNQFTGVFPSFEGCPIVYLDAQHNQFSSYTPQIIAASCHDFYAQYNSFPAASINAILADVANGIAGRPSGGVLAINGTGNAAPTGQGITDKATITARPWTCSTN